MSGRGRSKKVKVQEVSTDVVVDEPVKKTKKKQFPVVAMITPDGIEGNLMLGSRQPLVVHLPIQSRDVPINDMPITYNPLPPSDAQPYDSYSENPFHEEMENILSPPSTIPLDPLVSLSSLAPLASAPSTTGMNVAPTGAMGVGMGVGVGSVEETTDSAIDFYRMKGAFLVQYKNSSDVKTIPLTSDAACFWCCQSFSHRPVVLPVRDTGEYLIVSGNFCCPECACAYLFDMRQDAHTRWEQLSLLYRVYGEVCQGNIHPAPHRTLLKMFGGCLTGEQYRKMIRSYKVRVDIHLPPMVSILATMDTKPIDFYDASLTKNVNETVTERLQKAEEVLRLRRTKPLKAWESTLDACINLKIKYDASSTSTSTSTSTSLSLES